LDAIFVLVRAVREFDPVPESGRLSAYAFKHIGRMTINCRPEVTAEMIHAPVPGRYKPPSDQELGEEVAV
jgi:hypothetical protein